MFFTYIKIYMHQIFVHIQHHKTVKKNVFVKFVVFSLQLFKLCLFMNVYVHVSNICL